MSSASLGTQMLKSPRYLESCGLRHQYQELEQRPAYSGLTATVVVATKVDTDELVAIKVVDKRRLGTDSIRSTDGRGDISELGRARSEILMHQSLPKHSNVVPLLASEETLDTLLLVTPFARDGDLWEHTRFSATLSEIEARNCTWHIASGLELLHSRGVVHGDMKPHNILLFRERESTSNRLIAQLCDFGLSEVAPVRKCGNRIIRYTGLRGTSGYFSPELVNEEDYAFGVDVFALGTILFRLICGYEPFYPPSNFTEVEFEDACWDLVSEECKNVIRRMLEFDQHKRISIQEVLVDPWFSVKLPLDAESALCFYPPNEIPGSVENRMQPPSAG